MRIRIVVALLFALAIGIVGVRAAKSTSSPSATKPLRANATQQPAAVPIDVSKDRPGTINGDVNPDLIPDHVAYSILFRLIADRKTDAEKNRVDSYIRNMLGVRCKRCGPLEEAAVRTAINEEPGRTPEQENADIAAMFAAAEDFHQKVSLLDKQAKDIKQRRRRDSTLEATPQLTNLQTQKNSIVNSKAAALLKKLSPVSRGKLQKFINEQLKRRIKMTPSLHSSASAGQTQPQAPPAQ